MRCPACEASATAAAEACPNGHPLRDENGVFVLLSRDERASVSTLEESVAQWRAAQGHIPVPAAALPDLPDGAAVSADPEWRIRRYDLEVVIALLAERPRSRILDVGAWNGWFSHRLSELGHEVTASDVFAGPAALGARWPEPPTWRRVQAEPLRLDRIDEVFDVIIVDRCIQFFPDPAAAITVIRRLLAPGGLLITTGLMVYRAADEVRARRDSEARRFRRRFGRDLLLHEAKGYLEPGDLRRCEAVGLRTWPYDRLRLANLRAKLDRSRPEHRYGTLEVQ